MHNHIVRGHLTSTACAPPHMPGCVVLPVFLRGDLLTVHSRHATALQAAQDTLGTLNYVSKFRTGKHDAIVISAVWDDNTAFADSAAAASAAVAAARAQMLAAPRLMPSAEDIELCNQASPDGRWASTQDHDASACCTYRIRMTAP
jgi:hypothetical protein